MQYYLDRFIKLLKNSKAYLVVFSAAYVLGVVVGLFFSTDPYRMVLSGNVLNYCVNALSNGKNTFSFILTVVVSDAVFIAVFWGLSYSFILILSGAIPLFYRGFVLGSAAVLFVKLFGVSGAFIFVFCVLLHSVISSLGFVLFLSVSASLIRKGKDCIKGYRRDLLLLAAAFSVVAILAEILVIILFIRPINTTF